MLRNIATKKLWDLFLTYVMDNHSLAAQPIYTLYGITPYDILTVGIMDI